MFRLLKLAMYAVVGYALYELYRGIAEQREEREYSAGGSPERAGLTGRGEGMDIASEDSDGGSIPHKVGRGVVV